MAKTRQKTSPYGPEKFRTIDAYHAAFPEAIQKKLNQIRSIIRKSAPGAAETISYNIPTFKLQQNLVHYAAFKNHIGFYPTSRPIEVFKDELSAYKTSKGAIQFPINRPLPSALIRSIVKYRVEQVSGATSSGGTWRTCKLGHRFVKSSDCPTCPVCEAAKRPASGWLAKVAAPARRALEHAGIKTLKQLSACTEAEILDLHGIGKATIPKLKRELKSAGFAFRG